MIQPIKILFFFAAYKRTELLNLCLKNIKRLKRYNPERFDISAFCVYSTDEEKKVLNNYDIQTFQTKNFPIGQKKNAGLWEALKLDFDYLFEIGSDDLIHENLLDLYYGYMMNETQAFGINNCYLLNVDNFECLYYTNPYIIGAGRCIKKSILTDNFGKMIKVKARCSFSGPLGSFAKGNEYILFYDAFKKLQSNLKIISDYPGIHFWDNDMNDGLDFNSMLTLNKHGIKLTMPKISNFPYIVDLKSDENVHSFEDMEKSKCCVKSDKQLVNYFEEIKQLEIFV